MNAEVFSPGLRTHSKNLQNVGCFGSLCVVTLELGTFSAYFEVEDAIERVTMAVLATLLPDGSKVP